MRRRSAVRLPKLRETQFEERDRGLPRPGAARFSMRCKCVMRSSDSARAIASKNSGYCPRHVRKVSTETPAAIAAPRYVSRRLTASTIDFTRDRRFVLCRSSWCRRASRGALSGGETGGDSLASLRSNRYAARFPAHDPGADVVAPTGIEAVKYRIFSCTLVYARNRSCPSRKDFWATLVFRH